MAKIILLAQPDTTLHNTNDIPTSLSFTSVGDLLWRLMKNIKKDTKFNLIQHRPYYIYKWKCSIINSEIDLTMKSKSYRTKYFIVRHGPDCRLITLDISGSSILITHLLSALINLSFSKPFQFSDWKQLNKKSGLSKDEVYSSWEPYINHANQKRNRISQLIENNREVTTGPIILYSSVFKWYPVSYFNMKKGIFCPDPRGQLGMTDVGELLYRLSSALDSDTTIYMKKGSIQYSRTFHIDNKYVKTQVQSFRAESLKQPIGKNSDGVIPLPVIEKISFSGNRNAINYIIRNFNNLSVCSPYDLSHPKIVLDKLGINIHDVNRDWNSRLKEIVYPDDFDFIPAR